jgi:exodeoxyribonuclease VII large subunit
MDLRRQDPAARLLAGRHRLISGQGCLERSGHKIIAARRVRLDRARNRLEGLSPVAVLARGYALVYGPDGTLLRSTLGISPGSTVRARLAEGSISAQITEITNP